MTNGKIVDSSTWIDFLSKKEERHVSLLKEAIVENCVLLLPVILQEILQGIKDDKLYKSVKNILNDYEILIESEVLITLGAVDIYRFLRKKGVTIRKPNDCLIAFSCIYYDVPLVHNDKDFDNIAKHTSLKIYK
jgi:predicted nucleic acid-binding protein